MRETPRKRALSCHTPNRTNVLRDSRSSCPSLKIFGQNKAMSDIFASNEEDIELTINKYLILRIVNNEIKIFVNNEEFLGCAFLLLDLNVVDFPDYDEIGSIDEAALNLGRGAETTRPEELSVEQEFWGHASNLQAWAELGYDTRILKSDLSFPLLKKLSEVGDPQAKKVFKKEIAERFSSHFFPVMEFLIKGEYLKHLNKEELKILMQNINPKEIKNIPESRKFQFYGDLASLGHTESLEEVKKIDLSIIEELDLKYALEFLDKIAKFGHPTARKKINELMEKVLMMDFSSIWGLRAYLTEDQEQRFYLGIDRNFEIKNTRLLLEIFKKLDSMGVPWAKKRYVEVFQDRFLKQDASALHQLTSPEKINYFGGEVWVYDLFRKFKFEENYNPTFIYDLLANDNYLHFLMELSDEELYDIVTNIDFSPIHKSREEYINNAGLITQIGGDKHKTVALEELLYRIIKEMYDFRPSEKRKTVLNYLYDVMVKDFSKYGDLSDLEGFGYKRIE